MLESVFEICGWPLIMIFPLPSDILTAWNIVGKLITIWQIPSSRQASQDNNFPIISEELDLSFTKAPCLQLSKCHSKWFT